MRIFTAALALALTAGAAHAQDMYVGVAFDYGKPHAGDDQTAASLMAGVAFDAGTIGYGAEIEYGASSTFGGDFWRDSKGAWIPSNAFCCFTRLYNGSFLECHIAGQFAREVGEFPKWHY
mgnify:CR=1 FL=1